MSEAATPAVDRDDQQSFLARCGPHAIAITRQPPTPESMARFGDLMRQAVAENPEAAYIFVALGADRPRLDEAVRQQVAELWREFGETVHVAVWVRRGSFAGALQRSFITALSLLRIARTPLKVVSGPEGALAWFLSLDPELERYAADWRAIVDRGLAD